VNPGFCGLSGAGRYPPPHGSPALLVRWRLKTSGFRRNHFPIAAKPSGNDHQLASAPIKQRGAIMWAFIISLVYDHSCKKYLIDMGQHQHRWI
jgi:hypothetical protein